MPELKRAIIASHDSVTPWLLCQDMEFWDVIESMVILSDAREAAKPRK